MHGDWQHVISTTTHADIGTHVSSPKNQPTIDSSLQTLFNHTAQGHGVTGSELLPLAQQIHVRAYNADRPATALPMDVI